MHMFMCRHVCPNTPFSGLLEEVGFRRPVTNYPKKDEQVCKAQSLGLVWGLTWPKHRTQGLRVCKHARDAQYHGSELAEEGRKRELTVDDGLL